MQRSLATVAVLSVLFGSSQLAGRRMQPGSGLTEPGVGWPDRPAK